MSLRMNVPLIACAAVVLTAGSALAADVVVSATEREDRKLVTVDLGPTTPGVTTIFNTPSEPDSLVIDSMGRYIYSEPVANEIRRFDPASNTDTKLADFTVGINFPQDIILSPDGKTLYVSNFVGGTITKTDLMTAACTPNCTGTTTFANVPTPEGLAFDAAGNLYALIGFGTASNIVVQFNSIGVIVKSSIAFDPTNTLDGLTFDAFTGHLFASSKNGNVLYNIDPTTLAAVQLPGTIPTPDGLITDNNGKLYIAARGDSPPTTGRVYSYNLVGNVITPLTLVPTIDDLGPIVLSPPTIKKTFGAVPPNLFVGQSTTMTFTITNSNSVPLNGINFTDPLPGGLVVSTPNGLAGVCDGGTITAVAGSGSVSLGNPGVGASLAAGASCTFSVNVTATAAGLTTNPQNNCVQASAPGAGPGNTSCALLTVLLAPPQLLPPTIGKAFGAATILLNTSTTLTFTITNPPANTTALTGVGFADILNTVLPNCLVVSTPNGLAGNSCTPPPPVGATGATGTITANAGAGTVSLAGATVAAGGSCTFSINVTGTAACAQINSVTVFDTTAGTGNTATAPLTVIAPPIITKSFVPASIGLNGSTVLTFVITNPNTTVALSTIVFSDTLPAGLQVSAGQVSPFAACSGTVTATALGSTISLSGGTLVASASCTFSVNVTATALGSFTNTTSTITSSGGVGPPATAVLAVTVPLYQIRYAANLDKGDSYINLTNAGTLNGADPAGRICANVYTFDPAEEMISCCACLVTPNGLNSLSAQRDLISNTLTPGKPTSIVIKLLASTPVGGTCNASTPTLDNLVRGLRAWGTTLHALPGTPTTYGKTETPFSLVELSNSELSKLTTFCGFIQTIGSGFGICKSCQTGALGGVTQ